MAYSDKQRQADYKVIFGTPLGRKVLTDILIKGNVFTPVNAPGEEAHRQEGARQLALHIASFVRFDADKFADHWQSPEDA